MNRFIDLHIHSNCSDGSCSPSEIAELAHQANLAAAALTDHDNIDGVEEFLEAGKKYPDLECVPGVEISAMYGSREMHLVGLYIDVKNEPLHEFLQSMRKSRLERNILMAKKLYSLGYPIDSDILDYVHNDRLGRVHFAAYLIKHYNFENFQAVFDKLLRRNCAAFVNRKLPLPSEAIAAVKNAGGAAIWAHPVSNHQRNESSFVKRMIQKLKPFGLDGLECYYSMFDKNETNMLLGKAATFDMLVSGGSDFHGANRPKISVGSGGGGLQIPEAVLTKIKERLGKNAQ